MNRTLEQERATYALNSVQQNAKRYAENKQKRDKLATQIQKTPIRILQNGLGQTLAFLLADNEGKTNSKREPSGYLYDHLQEWLCGNSDPTHPCRVYTNTGDLISQLVNGSRDEYLRAQEETLMLFNWLKKFSDAYLSES